MIFDDSPNIQNESKGFKQILGGGADRSARKARAAIGAERLVYFKLGLLGRVFFHQNTRRRRRSQRAQSARCDRAENSSLH